MARHTVRGLLGVVIASLLISLVSLAAHPAPTAYSAASSRVSLVTVASRHGLKVQTREQGAELALIGNGARMDFVAGSREASWNGYRLFLGEAPIMRSRQMTLTASDWISVVRPLLDPSAAPSPGEMRLVVIDPGHGGSDPGTENRALKLKEKTYTLDVARRLIRVLGKQGYRVLLTRTSDTRLKPTQADDLEARAEKANRAGADLFISLHFNSLPDNATVRGIETYALTPAGQRSTATIKSTAGDHVAYPGNRHDHWNMVLSSLLHRRLVGQLAATDRGLKHARFAVLRPLKCPAALVEGGFLSSHSEAQKIRSASYRQQMAEAIADGVADYAVRLRAASAKKNL